MIPVTLDEADLLTRTLWGEARGEPPIGRWAVAWVAINRVMDTKRRWPRTLMGVLTQPRQFTCWNDDKPLCGLVGLDDKSLRECYAAAWEVLSGIQPDPTHGSNHYLTRALADKAPPEWFDWSAVQFHSGGHVFLRLV